MGYALTSMFMADCFKKRISNLCFVSWILILVWMGAFDFLLEKLKNNLKQHGLELVKL